MTTDTKRTVTISEANQDTIFSKADEDFTASDEDVFRISKQLMEQNREAYEVLAK